MKYILVMYKKHLFTDEQMELFVKRNMITQEQYDSVKQ